MELSEIEPGERRLSRTAEASDFSLEELALLDLGRFLIQSNYSFSTLTPLSQRRVTRRHNKSEATDLRGIFGWSLPFRPERFSKAFVELVTRAGVIEQRQDRFKSTVRFSSLRGNLYVHSAFPTDEDDAVFFGPDTVRFINAISAHVMHRDAPLSRMIDIGCGSGAGGLSLAAMTNANVILSDVNEKALRWTRVNAALNGLSATTQTVKSDVLADISGSFDLIISNPPYLVDLSKRAYRHGGGSFGEALSLRILQEASRRLSVGGTLLLYTGSAIINGQDQFLARARSLLSTSKLTFEYTELDPDVFGEELEHSPYEDADRIAAVLLTATRGK